MLRGTPTAVKALTQGLSIFVPQIMVASEDVHVPM